MFLRGLCLLLLAAPAFAGGITSWEPDTTQRHGRGDREPMVETPIWYGLTYSAASRYERGWNGFTGAPNQFGAIATGVTWPWRSRLQGWSEFGYMLRTLRDKGIYHSLWPPTTYAYDSESKHDMFTLRGGVEYRFGTKSRPWCTAGGGVGFGFAFGDVPAVATETVGRVTCFLYPSQRTRLGFVLAGGPAWIARSGHSFPFAFTDDDRYRTRTHYEIGLRIESRLRFPVANAD